MKRLALFILASFFTIATAFATININTASESELETLNGIGPNRAKSIIEYRKQHGKFHSIEDVKKVPGIKEAVYHKIKRDIATSGANVPPKKESFGAKTGRALDRTAAKVKEKTASVVHSSAEYIEKKAKAVKDDTE